MGSDKHDKGEMENMSADQLLEEWKKMFHLFKISTDTTWGTISMMQSQAERIANLLLNQYATLQAEGRKHLEDWISSTRKNQEELQKAYSEGMEKIGDLLPSCTEEQEQTAAADDSDRRRPKTKR